MMYTTALGLVLAIWLAPSSAQTTVPTIAIQIDPLPVPPTVSNLTVTFANGTTVPMSDLLRSSLQDQAKQLQWMAMSLQEQATQTQLLASNILQQLSGNMSPTPPMPFGADFMNGPPRPFMPYPFKDMFGGPRPDGPPMSGVEAMGPYMMDVQNMMGQVNTMMDMGPNGGAMSMAGVAMPSMGPVQGSPMFAMASPPMKSAVSGMNVQPQMVQNTMARQGGPMQSPVSGQVRPMSAPARPIALSMSGQGRPMQQAMSLQGRPMPPTFGVQGGPMQMQGYQLNQAKAAQSAPQGRPLVAAGAAYRGAPMG